MAARQKERAEILNQRRLYSEEAAKDRGGGGCGGGGGGGDGGGRGRGRGGGGVQEEAEAAAGRPAAAGWPETAQAAARQAPRPRGKGAYGSPFGRPHRPGHPNRVSLARGGFSFVLAHRHSFCLHGGAEGSQGIQEGLATRWIAASWRSATSISTSSTGSSTS